jgi:hypothetical protein
VPDILMRALLQGAVWAGTLIVLSWGSLPAALRRGLALATSAAGMLFLVLALGAEGQRESAATGSFLLQERYVVPTAPVSAALPYYVLTAVCLLLGTLGLALPDALAHRLRAHWVAVAVALGLMTTAVRFALEKAAAPRAWTWAAGVTLLPPIVGAAFAWNVRDARNRLGALVRALFAYGLAVRAGVALMYTLATTMHLGSHYDLSLARIALTDFGGRGTAPEPGSLAQLATVVFVPQLLLWPLFTVLAGLTGALPVLLVLRDPAGDAATGMAASRESPF